jgi:hypothetical protein
MRLPVSEKDLSLMEMINFSAIGVASGMVTNTLKSLAVTIENI